MGVTACSDDDSHRRGMLRRHIDRFFYFRQITSFSRSLSTAQAITFFLFIPDSFCTSVSRLLHAASFYRRRSIRLTSRVKELEASLQATLDKAASERRGRTRAQKALRKKLLDEQPLAKDVSLRQASYFPMMPIAVVRSCFSTRNGTPRQPLLVPLARARLVLDPSRAPQDALEGLADYSHLWIIYVFHLNTDLDKLWNEPSRSKLKAKVRVPRLNGERVGVLATRSPHRPCPIGLTLAKVESVEGDTILLSGVDLVDGTPVIDIKPYLPYSDCIVGASTPQWLQENGALAAASVAFSSGFRSSLVQCWETAGKHSLYKSPDELQSLIEQVLSWDIRSFSQRNRLAEAGCNVMVEKQSTNVAEAEDFLSVSDCSPHSSSDITYHVALEGLDVHYTIDGQSNVTVEKVTIQSLASNGESVLE